MLCIQFSLYNTLLILENEYKLDKQLKLYVFGVK